MPLIFLYLCRYYDTINAMTPKTISYLKVFSLFLLMVAAVTFIIVFAKQYLRQIDINPSLLDVFLSAILICGYLYAWNLLSRRLKDIEKH